ncbi:MAG: hypothetical protein KTR16_07670 [Acidiferrobacterales bacterium]|nr:hypothetical protein [Acidiferrobacterales bacterium]
MMDLQLVRLLQLVSPALPVGAFAYSQGLESAVDSQLICDEKDTLEWVGGVLQNNICNLDLPALQYQMQYLSDEKDKKAIQDLNDRLIAFRETKELRAESLQMARALCRLLRDLDIDLQLLPKGDLDWVTAFAMACVSQNIDSENAKLGYAWSWCENQIAAAIKLVPLGQTQGQRLLHKLGSTLPEYMAKTKQIDVENIGAIAPHLAILSSQHEVQYSRLFRS